MKGLNIIDVKSAYKPRSDYIVDVVDMIVFTCQTAATIGRMHYNVTNTGTYVPGVSPSGDEDCEIMNILQSRGFTVKINHQLEGGFTVSGWAE